MNYKNQPIFPVEFYSYCLTTINSIKFSKREIDIIACILSGRSAKGIAQFLSIAPKTAESHTYNILRKLDCTSREGLISLMERSDKFLILKQYYIHLLAHMAFERALKDISNLIADQTNAVLIIIFQKQEKINSLLQKIQSDLDLAGIKVSIEIKEQIGTFKFSTSDSKEGVNTIYVVPELQGGTKKAEMLQKCIAYIKKNPSHTFFLSFENDKEITKDFNIRKFINFFDDTKYYASFFGALKRLLPHINLNSIIEEFNTQCKFPNELTEVKNYREGLAQKRHSVPRGTKNFIREGKGVLLIGLSIGLSIIILVVFMIKGETGGIHYSIVKSPIRSDLALPTSNTLINRLELIEQIGKKLKGQNGIQSIALVGIGGAGKSTLARQYAHLQAANIIWELNAENHTSLMKSFEDLAYRLAKTEEDKRVLRELLSIKHSIKREENLLEFVKKGLNLHSRWFLVYDNVENFSDIQKYFPQDPKIWGEGKIILTTRNTNIQNSGQIDNFIEIRELNPEQMHSLFLQIMNNTDNSQLTMVQQKKNLEFLKQLPPFPLDISVAAYYIKTMNTSYESYLEYLNHQDKNFSTIQKNLLKEVGAYEKTRYSIITLSLEKLMATDKNFVDLLLFISLLDSQHIPRDLLDLYKGKVVVDNFIYYLKKYSLIMNGSPDSSRGSTYSIHRSTQAITLAYLIQKLGLEENNSSIKLIGNTLKNYVRNILDAGDFSKMKQALSHSEAFLSHENVLPITIKGMISGEVGHLYHMLSNYNKAEKNLKRSVSILKDCLRKNETLLFRPITYLGGLYWRKGHFKQSQEYFEEGIEIYKRFKLSDINGICYALSFLGMLYIEQSQFEKAKNVLEEGLLIHQNSHSRNHSALTFILAQLGYLYRRMGVYKKSIFYAEKALSIDKKHYPRNSPEVGESLANLGLIYSHVGYFEVAKNLYEQSLVIAKQYFPETSLSFAWELRNLGAAYNDLGDFKKAHNLLEQSFLIFKQTLGLNNIKTQWVCFLLGEMYKNSGDLKKAKTIFEGCLPIYIKNYGKNSLYTADVLRGLGEIYLLENDTEKAEDFLAKALNINKMRKHPLLYKVLEIYANFHITKSLHSANEGDSKRALKFKNEALNNLEQALEIVTTHFPEDSPHIIRIRDKIKESKETQYMRRAFVSGGIE